MQILIDIPEEIYKASQIIDVKYEDVIQIPLEVIAKGTPLFKGHGDLIDINDIEPMSYTVDGGDYYDDYKAIDWEDIKNAPTIIPADTESEG